MDSQYGGIPSPILLTENGYQKFYPLPIPFPQDQSSVKYSDLNFVDNYSVWDFIKDVAPKLARVCSVGHEGGVLVT